jgi:hypothetical protein
VFGLDAGSSVTVFPSVFVTQILFAPSTAIPVGSLKEKLFPEKLIPPEGVQESGGDELPPPPPQDVRINGSRAINGQHRPDLIWTPSIGFDLIKTFAFYPSPSRESI